MTNDNKYVTKRKRILMAPDKLQEECTNSLAKLWRIILSDLQIDESSWKELINLYLTDPINGFEDDKSALTDNSGNLNSALCYTNMQMMIFIRALRFLQVTMATYEFTLHFATQASQSYSITIYYGQNNELMPKSVLEEDTHSNAIEHKRRFIAKTKNTALDTLNKIKKEIDLEALLSDPNKKVNKATGMLSKVWRRILSKNEITLDRWKTLSTRYLHKIIPETFEAIDGETHKEKVARYKKRSNVKVNVKDELIRPAFTINVFMKGMVFIEVESIDISIRIKRLNSDRLTTHTLLGWNPIDDFLKPKQ